MNREFKVQSQNAHSTPTLPEKLGIRRQTTLRLPVDKALFHRRLNAAVEPGGFGVFSGLSDLFSSGDKEYVGHVEYSTFKIRPRHRFFQTSQTVATATGKFWEDNGAVRIDLTVDAFSTQVKLMYAGMLLFYAIFMTAFVAGAPMPAVFYPFLVIQALLMLGIPFFVMRRSAGKMARELEREFVYLTR